MLHIHEGRPAEDSQEGIRVRRGGWRSTMTRPGRSACTNWVVPVVVVAGILSAQSPSAAQRLGAVPTAGALSTTPVGAPPRPSIGGNYADPDVVSLSGWVVTPDDIRLFDNKWMTQDQHDSFTHVVHNAFWIGYDPFGVAYENVVWMIGERMAAMARMYDLTRAPKYLDELRGLADLVLAGRDDHIDLQPEPAPQYNPAFQPNPPSRADGLRGNRVMPAWGYRRVGNGGYHSSDLAVAGVYAYPIAAFARIVAEDPTLYATYGASARAAATGVLEMLEAFRPELHDQSLAPGGENYFAHPVGNRLLTYDACSQAHSAALQNLYRGLANWSDPTVDPTAWANEDRQTLETEYHKCYTDFHAIAGFPLAHNEYQAFVMALIELSRALDSDWYIQGLPSCRPVVSLGLSPSLRIAPQCHRQQQYVLDEARQTIPAIVAGAQRFYRNRFSYDFWGPAGRPRFLWYYLDENPSSIAHDLDNTSHAALEMSYVGLLWRNSDRLNALLASSPSGSDHIMLSATDMSMLANTFLDVIVTSNADANGFVHTHLAKDLYRHPDDPIDAPDSDCNGWLNLAEFDYLVYKKCETVTLHLWDPSIDNPTNDPTIRSAAQPHLGVGNHAALLALKQFRATDHR
jgi:hypothetical protein